MCGRLPASLSCKRKAGEEEEEEENKGFEPVSPSDQGNMLKHVTGEFCHWACNFNYSWGLGVALLLS